MAAGPLWTDTPRRGMPDLEERLRGLSGAALRDVLSDALQQIQALQARNARLGRQVAGLARQLARARVYAYHDELTGLPNRRLLMDHFHQARAHAQRRRQRLALLFIDLDGFKHVNDRFGHLAGDAILKEVASRLKASVRDDETACRFGGDEFVILLNDCEDEHDARRVVDRIRARLSGRHVLQGTAIEVKASVGLAIYPGDGQDWADLIQVADISMLKQKQRSPALPEAP